MKKRTFNKWLFVVMLAIAVSAVLVIRDASATNRNDPDVDVDQRQEQDQSQEQEQSQDQSQSQDQTNDQSQANDQTVNFNGPSELKTTGRAYQSSGDATADCQKFGGISSGWVGGALGLGINFTDKECRQLKVYDRLVDRGLLKVANATLCQTKTLRKLYGRDGSGQCQTELETAYVASQGAGSTEIRDEMDELREMVRKLSETSRQAPPASPDGDPPYSEYEGAAGSTAILERTEDCPDVPDCPDCEEQATRAFEQCVAK